MSQNPFAHYRYREAKRKNLAKKKNSYTTTKIVHHYFFPQKKSHTPPQTLQAHAYHKHGRNSVLKAKVFREILIQFNELENQPKTPHPHVR